MASKLVTLTGVLTYEDAGAPPGVNVPVFPTHPIAPGGPPLGIWGGAPLPVPTPPIYYPQPPLGIWGGAPLPTPTPPIYYPPGVNVPVFPTHPIAPGGPPPGIWPSPGHPAHPIYLPPGVNVPVFPTNPIAPGGPPPTVSNPISGGGYVVGWSPVYGYVVIPIGGAQPIGGEGGEGGGGEQPTHPIAPGGPEPK